MTIKISIVTDRVIFFVVSIGKVIGFCNEFAGAKVEKITRSVTIEILIVTVRVIFF